MTVTVPIFGEPRAVRRWVRAERANGSRFVPGDSPGAGGTPAPHTSPPVCVAVERFPEEWPAARVRGLVDRFPLSAWVVAVGPWATGGGRTGSPWPGGARCSCAEALVRVAEAVASTNVPPPTAGRADVGGPPAGVGPVTVFGPDRVWRETTEQLFGGTDGPRWEVWDLDAWDDRRAMALTASRLDDPGRVRVGACSVQPHLSRTHASGLDRVVGKWDSPGVVWAAVQSLASS